MRQEYGLTFWPVTCGLPDVTGMAVDLSTHAMADTYRPTLTTICANRSMESLTAYTMSHIGSRERKMLDVELLVDGVGRKAVSTDDDGRF